MSCLSRPRASMLAARALGRNMPARIKIRRRRRTKIIATLGPASSTAGGDGAAVPCRGGRVPAEFQPRHARRPRRAHRHDPRPGKEIRPSDRHPGRRAGPETARRPVRRRAGAAADRPARSRLDLNPTPGDVRRVNLPHPEIIAAAAHRHHPAARRRQAAAARDAGARRPSGDRDRRSAARCPTARASTCPTWCCRSRR